VNTDTVETKPSDPGAGIVVRGLFLFVLLVVVVGAGYLLIFRRSAQVAPAPLADPAATVGLWTVPAAGFPATLSWGALHQLADNLPSAPGWEIRYTAASSLARRGSADIPWEVFEELLDERRQFRNFRVRLQDGRLVPDEAAARQIILRGLQALAEWHKKQDRAKGKVSDALAKGYAAVDKLTESPVLELRAQAEKTRATFFRE